MWSIEDHTSMRTGRTSNPNPEGPGFVKWFEINLQSEDSIKIDNRSDFRAGHGIASC